MANYYASARTNYFRVEDEEKYKELFSGLSAEYELYDFSKKDENGVIWHAFGAYSSIDYLVKSSDDPDDDEYEYDFDAFTDALSEILPENEAFIMFEVGAEKLRYLVGWAIVVTKGSIQSISLGDWAVNRARELLGDDTFTTQTDY